ncbi:alcohol dehydrogenase catalytic domain-containing protein [Gracilibacillus salitolerans]|uniref:Alcohol dehydrogenase catalytic domain-containing protein n=1 Tax=Gracilibacillus salitolerans TaxID=2663022 RepID=A0A5Q2TE79_9BACI|nr:zinc-binding alcohol dehydrogenase family protein [Gracilibacillus salitolerans]QGH32936.1 alcohol dehydrogenase catalytic domain-containing protein [Gracilibacillus salitolerans]
MRAIVCEEPRVFKPINQERPQLEKGTALVNVKRIGVCGTDLHAFTGNQPFFEYPRILGHELAGVIESVGKNPYGLEQGDQVSVIPYMECGECIACKKGLTNCCTNMQVMGVHFDGGMTEQISVPYDHLIKTNALTLDQSAILEPLSIGAHAVRRSDLQKSDFALVIGAGPIGLGVMQAAKQKGAKVIAMDMNDERLAFSEQWVNVDYSINVLNGPVEQLMNITNGDMPSIVYDATGNSKSMMDAFQYPANGGKLVYVGLVKSDITFSDPLFHSKELTLMASRNATKEDFDFVINSIENGFIDEKSFITHRSTFDNLPNEFENWLKPENGIVKAMIEI